jgi:hypothetical protein
VQFARRPSRTAVDVGGVRPGFPPTQSRPDGSDRARKLQENIQSWRWAAGNRRRRESVTAPANPPRVAAGATANLLILPRPVLGSSAKACFRRRLQGDGRGRHCCDPLRMCAASGAPADERRDILQTRKTLVAVALLAAVYRRMHQIADRVIPQPCRHPAESELHP